MDPFCRAQKKDSDASGIHKAIKNTPAFGTRVPERTFCVLRKERAKIWLEHARTATKCKKIGRNWAGRLSLVFSQL